MTLVLTIVAGAVALLVSLITCIQILYLESLRIRARELPSLQFFKETLEARIGLTTERGSLTFSLLKHLGLAVVGCLTLAATSQSTPPWEALAAACLLVGAYVVVGTYIVPQLVYRKTSGHGLLPWFPYFVCWRLSRSRSPGRSNFCSRCSISAARRRPVMSRGRTNTSRR